MGKMAELKDATAEYVGNFSVEKGKMRGIRCPFPSQEALEILLTLFLVRVLIRAMWS